MFVYCSGNDEAANLTKQILNTLIRAKTLSTLIELSGISPGINVSFCTQPIWKQVFDGTPAANEGTLQSGDELLGVNGQSVKGKTKVAVAKMIQTATNEVTIHYNKLHADPTQGESLDIALKKLKHRFVEGMSENISMHSIVNGITDFCLLLFAD